jgi:hypothetical protein
MMVNIEKAGKARDGVMLSDIFGIIVKCVWPHILPPPPLFPPLGSGEHYIIAGTLLLVTYYIQDI